MNPIRKQYVPVLILPEGERLRFIPQTSIKDVETILEEELLNCPVAAIGTFETEYVKGGDND